LTSPQNLVHVIVLISFVEFLDKTINMITLRSKFFVSN
jgi:hypothetical protein